ncbi:hypothetical protein MARCHEWKA_00530 [Brevundimonas phage vB_BpoS-Marchewka]|uniref:Uncharacterized protein n=1 Tax=Brevundimonas phage vB_BpoS-Marchewka TaxID=2948604 RepID=A0A9E7SSB5_9CAUD|nr:hypothetical protein MARCHEWKA_00530 [Brevundimonas phage vB_BpoS-Marchewka]
MLTDTGLPSPSVENDAVTGTLTARFSDALLAEVFEADAEALTLRTVVERLGYAVTEEIDAILRANPTGPWSLEDLETMFGPRDDVDDKTSADCRARFPHTVRFAEWVGDRDVMVHALPTPPPDWSDFPILSPGFDDGAEDTRL